MTRLVRILGMTLFVVEVLVLAALLALRLPPVQRAALRLAVPRVAKLLGVGIRVGGISGSMTGTLTLRDVEIDDRRGRPLIRAARVTARYRLAALLGHSHTVDEIDLEGGWLSLGLEDGRMAVVDLGGPDGPPSPPRATPIVVTLPKIRVAGRVDAPEQALAGAFHIEGALRVGGDVDLRVRRGAITVGRDGGIDVVGRAIIDGAATHLDGVRIELRADGERMPWPGLRGLITARVEADGPISALTVAATVVPERGGLQLDGVVDLRHGDGQARVIAEELRPADFLAAAPGGAVSFDVAASRQSGKLTGDASVSVSRLRAPRVSVEALDALVQLAGDDGHVDVHARGLRGGGVDVASAHAVAHGRFSSQQVSGTLDSLELVRRHIRWATLSPAHVTAIFGRTVSVEHFRAGSGAQRIGVDGRYWLRDGDLSARVDGQHLDAQALAALLTPSQRIPHSDLDLRAEVTRRRVRALVDGDVSGSTLHLVVAVPLDGAADAPIEGQLRLSNLLVALQTRAPNLRFRWLDHATLDANVAVAGTLAAPTADAHVKLAFAPMSLAQGQARLTARYDGKQARVSLRASAKQPDGKPIGAVDGEATIDAGFSVAGWRPRASTHGSVQGGVALHNLALAGLRAFRIETPFRSGTVEASVELGGDLASPTARAQVSARDLVSGRLRKLDIELSSLLEQRRAKATLAVALEGRPFAKGTATAEVTGMAFAAAPIVAHIDLVPYALSKLSWVAHGLDGTLSGTVDAGGSLAAPDAKARIDIAGIHLGESRYDDLRVDAALTGGKLTGHAVVLSGHDQRLVADAALGGGAVDVHARLDHFAVDLRSDTIPGVRVLRGILDGDARISGVWPQLRPEGRLALHQGEASLERSPMEMRDISFVSHVSGDQVFLDRLSISAGDDGKATVSGRATLVQGLLRKLSAHVSTKRLPLSQGGLSGWLDLESDISAERTADRTQMRIDIVKGALELPELANQRQLQSTGPLDDVTFVGEDVDRRPPSAIEVLVATHTPIQIRSPEATIGIATTIRVAPVSDGLGVFGRIDGSKGHVILLGRRYDVQRMHVIFDGAARPDPALDVRVARPMLDATMMVDVRGTAKKPLITFRSDPAIYTEAQVLGQFISGDGEAAHISDNALDQQAIGAVSGLVVGRIKDELVPKLPVDLIRIDVGNEGYSDFSTSRLEAGKYLTENLYLAYVHQFGSAPGSRPTNANEGRLDLRFLRHLLLETRFGDAAVGAIDVFWTHRF